LLLAPAANGRFVAFPRPLFGLLARPAQVFENLPDMGWMIRHMERLGNYFDHAAARPKIGTITSLQWASQENLYQLSLLGLVQAGLAAGMWLGFQSTQTSFLHSLTPPPHRRLRSTNDFRYLANIAAFQ
jgi:hypothetical protein